MKRIKYSVELLSFLHSNTLLDKFLVSMKGYRGIYNEIYQVRDIIHSFAWSSSNEKYDFWEVKSDIYNLTRSSPFPDEFISITEFRRRLKNGEV